MVRSQQNVIPLLEAIVLRLEKLESADDAREHGHEKGNSSFSRGKKQGKERTQSVRCFKCGQDKKVIMQGGVPLRVGSLRETSYIPSAPRTRCMRVE